MIKLQGALVALKADSSDGVAGLSGSPTLTTEGARVHIRHDADENPEVVDGRQQWKADLVFELDHGLTLGYRGFYTCDAPPAA